MRQPASRRIGSSGENPISLEVCGEDGADASQRWRRLLFSRPFAPVCGVGSIETERKRHGQKHAQGQQGQSRETPRQFAGPQGQATQDGCVVEPGPRSIPFAPGSLDNQNEFNKAGQPALCRFQSARVRLPRHPAAGGPVDGRLPLRGRMNSRCCSCCKNSTPRCGIGSGCDRSSLAAATETAINRASTLRATTAPRTKRGDESKANVRMTVSRSGWKAALPRILIWLRAVR